MINLRVEGEGGWLSAISTNLWLKEMKMVYQNLKFKMGVKVSNLIHVNQTHVNFVMENMI